MPQIRRRWISPARSGQPVRRSSRRSSLRAGSLAGPGVASGFGDLQRSVGNAAVASILRRSGAPIPVPRSDRSRPIVVQRFEAKEHEWLGNAGSGGIRVPLGGGYSLTFGEMVAMAGDHFASIDQMRSFARKKGPGPGGVDELEYVRRVDVHGEKTPPEFEELSDSEKFILEHSGMVPPADLKRIERKKQGAAAAAAAKKRYYALAGKNQSHFLRPKGNAPSFADPQLSLMTADLLASVGIPAKDVLIGGAANYRNYHVRAIRDAVLAGHTESDLAPALATEAFAAHYLTDAFAGGHVETERISISEHWNARQPMFQENLIGYIAETMAKAYAATVTVGPFQLRPDVAYHFGARSAVEGALASKGAFTFGDLVSGAVHDLANERGLKAAVDTGMSTELVALFGDGNLGTGDEKRLATEAVRRGVQEVGQAYELARKKPKPSVATVLRKLAPDSTFSPEKMLPQSTTPTGERPMWKHDTVADLFADPRMKDALRLFGEEKASELASAAASLDADQKKLFLSRVVEPFRNDPIGLLRKVLAWTPDTGGGALGHNTDDNALDYVNAARKAGGLGSLSYDQRERLIGDLLDGATIGDDEDAIVDLLTSASDADARALIDHFTWSRLHDDIDDLIGNAFADRFPKARYGR